MRSYEELEPKFKRIAVEVRRSIRYNIKFGGVSIYRKVFKILDSNEKETDLFMISRFGGYSISDVERIKKKIRDTKKNILN